jgi:hypothetical protein
MTQATKPQQGVAVRSTSDAEGAIYELMTEAATPQDRARAFMLAEAMKQSKFVRGVASVVAATEWGAAMSPVRQVAYAKYCLSLGADPLRHVDLLGGSPFVNGDYYRDVIAANPEFRWASDPEWIHNDDRLQLCVACGKPFDAKPDHGHASDVVTEANTARLKERIARAGLRVLHAADEASPGICLLVLHYKNCPCETCKVRGSDGTGRGPFRGIGEVHTGKTDKGYERDPIGLKNPRTTPETRAWREAGEKAEATWFRTHASTIKQLEGKLVGAYEAEQRSASVEVPTNGVPQPVESEEVTIAPITNGPTVDAPPPPTEQE